MKNRLLLRLKDYRVFLLMLTPAMLFFLIFSYIPMVGIILAFKEYDFSQGIFGSPWNGFTNFRFFFIGGNAFTITRNTMLYNIVFIFFGNFLQLFCAICLSEMRIMRYRRFAQSLMFLPYFISWVLVGGFMYALFNNDTGMIPVIMESLGLDKPDVYGRPGLWPVIIVLTQAWKWVGYGTVIYLAAITSINPELYEAGMIDGANVFQLVRHITIPSLIPTVVTLCLIHFGQIFRGDFQMFYQLTGNNGTLFPTTDVIDTYVIRSLLTQSDYGMAAASGMYQSVLGFTMIVTVNAIVKKVNADYALF